MVSFPKAKYLFSSHEMFLLNYLYSSGSRTYQLEAPDNNAMMFWLQELQKRRREFSKTLDVSINTVWFFSLVLCYQRKIWTNLKLVYIWNLIPGIESFHMFCFGIFFHTKSITKCSEMFAVFHISPKKYLIFC